MSFEDADIVEALQALEAEIPDGYFEDFSRKVAGLLEVDSMQQSDVNAGGPASGIDDAWVAAGAAPGKNKKEDRDENSGLHEIQELATTAKRRISRRVSSQTDAEEALLASSSSGLHAIVLPEPGKEATGDVVSLPTAEERAAVAATPAPEPKRGIPAAVWAAVGTLAIAAAIVFFVVQSGNKDSAESTVATAAGDSSSDTAARGDTAAAAEQNAPDPAPAEPSVAALGADDGSGASPPPDDKAADSDAPVIADTESDVAADEAKADGKGGAAAVPAKSRARDSRDGDSDNKKKSKREERAARKKAEKEAKAKKAKPAKDEPKKAPKPGAKADMGDLLDSVTGGVDEKAEAKKDKKPTKKSLDRGDVAKAMGAVRSRAGACHDKEGATGQVKIRFTVAPSGKVSSAVAKGKFAGTPTGRCVASAVKRAKFPAFDGSPTSFTFPFLLSQ